MHNAFIIFFRCFLSDHSTKGILFLNREHIFNIYCFIANQMTMNFDLIGNCRTNWVLVYSHRLTPHSPIPIKWMLIVIVPSSPARQSFTSLFSFSLTIHMRFFTMVKFVFVFTFIYGCRTDSYLVYVYSMYPLTSICIHCIQIHVYLPNSKVDAIDMVKKRDGCR